MLPHVHLIIAAITIAPVAFTLFGGYQLLILWVIVGGLTTLLMDLNAFTLVLVLARSHESLRPYCNPFRIYSDFAGFMTAMAETGTLNTVFTFNLISGAIAPIIVYLVWPALAVPVVLGILTHLLSDVPRLRKAQSLN